LAHISAPSLGLEQAGDQVQQRRLAAARVADQGNELALPTVRLMSRSAWKLPLAWCGTPFRVIDAIVR
jgi:hypothetical protein